MLSVIAHELEEHVSGSSELPQSLRVLRESLSFISCDGEDLRSLGPFQDLEGPLVFFIELGSILGLPMKALIHVMLLHFLVDLESLLLAFFWGERLVASITLEVRIIGLLFERRNLIRVKGAKRTGWSGGNERLKNRRRKGEQSRKEDAGDDRKGLLMEIDD